LAERQDRSFGPWWTALAPLIALAFAMGSLSLSDGHIAGWLILVALPILFAAVFAAVHHAEVIAHRLGQPYGSILLALAVTVIEVALIVTLLLSDPGGDSSVARDTVFAAIMVVLNGVLGLCLLVGGLRHHRQRLKAHSATSALGVLATLATLTLVLPPFTLAVPGPLYSPLQLVFVAVVSLVLYAFFLYAQTVRHSADFLDPATLADAHAPVGPREFRFALGLLPLALLSVVLLAETLAEPLAVGIDRAGLPEALVGVAIAMVVLMPEGISAVQAARRNRLQTSVNLSLGSALASLCLTIPTVALISLALGQDLVLGLDAEHIVLLLLSLFIATMTLAMGRTTALQGGIHLVIFCAFLAFSAIP
jgi:Ca2+:H+ antiporter